MTKPDLLTALKTRQLLSDGAMGTQLQLAGLPSGGCGEMWNLTHPDKIRAIHRAYVEAGADLLTTNTFGANRIMLERHMPNPPITEINQAAVRLAREAFQDKPGYVIGDIGPFGGLMEPYGEYSREQVYASFFEQAQALTSAGADALIIETQTVLDELDVALEAARAAGAKIVIGSIAYDLTNETKEIRTMMGTGPEEAAAFMAEKGLDILALNCGAGMDMALAREVLQAYRSHCSRPVMVQPNAGLPTLEGGCVLYKQTPDELQSEARPLVFEDDVEIIGACCGSKPAHIAALAKLIQEKTERTQA